MGFSYHPPTRCSCEVCEKLALKDTHLPIIDTFSGRSSSSNGYPFHDWYNFVLGYTPTFPEYMLNRENIHASGKAVVLDPFVGSGTTQLVCKLNGIPSYGIDANDFMVFAASQKLNWAINVDKVEELANSIRKLYENKIKLINWSDNTAISEMAKKDRPIALDERYISDKPYIKVLELKKSIQEVNMSLEYYNFFMFTVSSILVPISNIKYGPGFGVGRKKDDVDVISLFLKKLDIMIKDLRNVSKNAKNTFSQTLLGDSRQLSKNIKENSISLIITSPPYPGDHEYTKHSKLELIFNEFATDLSSFRTIKKRMIRGSTTNIYKEDEEKLKVQDIIELQNITDEIDTRLKSDGATSGFEKLYTKLIWEYFGGMYNTLSESFKVLRPGGKIALLVSDSHAFKMVHIQTANLLQKVGEKVGFVNSEILLWQLKNSTSHKYQLRENILILQKPF